MLILAKQHLSTVIQLKVICDQMFFFYFLSSSIQTEAQLEMITFLSKSIVCIVSRECGYFSGTCCMAPNDKNTKVWDFYSHNW